MSGFAADLKPILRLFLAERRRALLLGAALSAATVTAGIALLGLSGWFITATSLAGLSAAAAITFDVFAPSAGIRLLAIVRTAARYGERLATHDATLSVLAALRERLFRGFAEPGAARTLLHRPAKLLFRLTADIDALDSLYLRILVPAAVAIGAALAASVVLGLMHPLFGLCFGLFLAGAGLALPLIAGRAARKHARRRAHGIEALRSRTIDLVAGQTDLLMAGRLAAQTGIIAAADAYSARADDRLNRVETGLTFGFGLVSTLLLTASLLAVAALAETKVITAPVAALGLLVAFAAVEPFTALRRGALELGRTLLAARRIAPRLAVAAAPEPLAVPLPGGVFSLAKVSAFHENSTVPALEDIELTLQPGERLAVIGSSGAGKSSLLALLSGELPARRGSVAAMTATLLTQRTELFEDSLRGNLLLANPDANEARLREALAAAGLLTDVEAMPGGIDTRLGEGGLGLSGGQSRRLALARLFLRDTPLWLLDEPTEGLDGVTARDVLARLSAMAAGRSLVIATHIRREAAIADRIAVIEGGRITEISRRGEAAFERALDRLRPD
ncbi:ATP-binding cassette domain-containing protein (plasmid) [Rhizobium leguminosarum bv. trifolii]|jgi:ATP-binding cassette subfamily C protein CydC|uniref:amino acid ABC transporter ATP-binding/permease protein n=1 Tax=Rhizobium ruizarguesonis TaxID=2081791 RepID=UPI0009496FDD|nr:ATP-binding cassette domain-containing protein [Rhizobium ruizarguesonis]MBY5830222.1 ATP-binding cassette domain-containing protein [Rhizobium leguminosarum]NKL10650.1 ATP-binding cassette domain-containing protein [Rhizobium leguminosarum bv. viciae]QIO48907.1 ATP-binding cassette domain-containing protein [Rhizobium leguminosarum bv. trifolii]MBC2807543.1 ATP-binding cassette domain-containing protein [Rhizobium ruizarguesonis]MBY5849215.1 ATP-binding cassette domain-containing protein [